MKKIKQKIFTISNTQLIKQHLSVTQSILLEIKVRKAKKLTELGRNKSLNNGLKVFIYKYGLWRKKQF